MTLRKLLVSLLLLFTISPALAQSPMQEIQNYANIVRTKYQTTQSMYDIYQMGGNAQGMQLCQVEAQLHQQVYNYLEQMAQNPGILQTPRGRQQFDAVIWEYDYRTKYQDYRSAQEIAPNLQQYVAQRKWEISTPQGQAAWQNRQAQNQAAFQASQNQVRANNASFDNYMNGLRAASNRDDKYHHQYVNTIHDNYEYVNPYDGKSYVMPNVFNQPPTMQNPDGSYTQMVPYQNW